MMMKYGTRAWMCLQIAAAIAVSTPAIAAEPLARIKAQGASLSAEGKPVTLRGVSLCSLEWHDPLGQIISASAPVIGWDVNVLRLPVQVKEWKRTTPEAYVRERIEPAVRLCRANGIYCILDWHAIAPWDEAQTDADLRAFWSYVAPLYADDPHILYEIFNEPTTPKSRTMENWRAWRDKAQGWVEHVRALAPETLLLVGSPHWDQMTGFAAEEPLKDGNVAYVAHVYPNWSPRAWDELFGKAAQKVPIFITEWGWSAAADTKSNEFHGSLEQYGEPLRRYLDARPNVNWTAWSYDPHCGPSMLGKDKDMGQFVKGWLRDIRRAEDQGAAP